MEILDWNILEKALSIALRSAPDFAEIFVEEKSMFSVDLEKSRPKNPTHGYDCGVAIRLIKDGASFLSFTNALTKESILNTARLLAISPNSAPRQISHHFSKTKRPGTKSKSIAKTVEKIRCLDNAARAGDFRVRDVRIAVSTSLQTVQVLNSDGIKATDCRRLNRCRIDVVAKDESVQSGFEELGGTENYNKFITEKVTIEAAESAARQAVVMLDAVDAPMGKAMVILGRGSGAVLFHEACGHALEADLVLNKSSIFCNRIGDRIASSSITLVDDGALHEGWASSVFDDEGNKTRRNILIHEGRLKGFLCDVSSARILKRQSTGNGRRQSYRDLPMPRMTNTYIDSGVYTPQEIFENTNKGIFVKSFTGGQANSATGEFVFGASEAYLVENGKITEPVKNVLLIGNAMDALKKVDMVGNDLQFSIGMCGKNGQFVSSMIGQPTVRIRELTAGGTRQWN